MTAEHGTPAEPTPSVPEALARIVRHEVGDLLQTVYATAAIFQERLPKELTLERRLMTDLRARAETCRLLLDTVHDYACPLTLSWEPVEPIRLVQMMVTREAASFPKVDVQVEADPATPNLVADPRRLGQVVQLLVRSACEMARERVVFRVVPGPAAGEVEWSVSDDGPGVPAEQLPRLFSPYPTSRHSLLGLRLALARKISELHGGRISVDNLPDGGFRVTLVLPPAPPGRAASGGS